VQGLLKISENSRRIPCGEVHQDAIAPSSPKRASAEAIEQVLRKLAAAAVDGINDLLPSIV